MRAHAWTGVVLTLLLGIQGCTVPAERSGAGPTRESRVVVVVTNHNWADMAVYAARGGARFRLGTVSSMETERFYLPSHITSGAATGIRLLADPIGSAAVFSTQPISVSSGQWIEFTIQNAINLSSFAVWTR